MKFGADINIPFRTHYNKFHIFDNEWSNMCKTQNIPVTLSCTLSAN